VDLDGVSQDLRRRFDARVQARERALPASRRAIRSCANAIRAIHRGEFELAHRLMEEARAAIDEGLAAVAELADIPFAVYLQDAHK
jgi:translin